MGIFIKPTIAKTELTAAALCSSLNDEVIKIYDMYINESISIEVNLASQAHQVPHVGLPHIDPVTRVIIENVSPIDASEEAQ